jgi:hypothetical protein
MAKPIIHAHLFAPRCTYPGCINKVGYHARYIKRNGNIGYKWKSACEEHRDVKLKKQEYEEWKLAEGCKNHDSHGVNKPYPNIPCTSTLISAAQIDVNHKDGNRTNNDQSNLECLCRNCHGAVTQQSGHHMNEYENETEYGPCFEVTNANNLG